MKKIMIALLLLGGTIATKEATAQVNISINIGNQPAWGPTGYNHVDFYYLPDINCYYDVNRSQFIYPNGNNWLYTTTLPGRYRNVNLYNMYKVVVNRPNPFRNNKNDIQAYARYKGQHNQPMIRDSRDERYYASKQHPNHNQWEQQHNNNNNGSRTDARARGNSRNSNRNNNGNRR